MAVTGSDPGAERGTWKTADVVSAWREYFRLVAELARTRLYDVLGHPDLPKKFGYRPADREIVEMVKPALDALAEAGMGMEINTSGLRKPVHEIYPSAAILEMARERGIPITFGSDAHRPDQVGYAFDQAVSLARQAGYTECLRMVKRKKRLVPIRG